MAGERKGFCFTMQQEEIWKDIPDYEGLYQASNLGRIKRLQKDVRGSYGSIRTLSEKICKQFLCKNGYAMVALSKNGVTKSTNVHRLIATTFLPNPNNLPQVNHKDECKTNNRADNLEWCTASHNINHGTRNEKVALKRSRKVKCYTKQRTLIGVFDGITKAARVLNLPMGAIPQIVNCCKGRTKSTHGYKWEYADSK